MFSTNLMQSFVNYNLALTCAEITVNKSKAVQKLNDARLEFYTLKAEGNPVYKRELYDINYNIRYCKKFAENRKTITVNQAWQGIVDKAYDPVKYIPHAILKGAVLQDSILDDQYASFFVRISIQNPFVKNHEGEFVVIREEISIDKINKFIYFMGRIPHESDYELLGADKNKANKQILFHDENKILNVDGDPIDSWTFLTIPTNGFSLADQQKFTDDMGALEIQPTNPEFMYKKIQDNFSSYV